MPAKSKQEARFGPWRIVFSPEDGARLNCLAYENTELLTAEPQNFHPPQNDYGAYEKRPVFGYDDCFPTVDSCIFPSSDWHIPDHGELCWLPWQIKKESNHLMFSVTSKNMPVKFFRSMRFDQNNLTWNFKVINNTEKYLPFLHVMHPLMPLDEIADVRLPQFKSVYDEIAQKTVFFADAEAMQNFLFSRSYGTSNMLILREIDEGRINWEYKSGLRLEVLFSKKLFPSIGIWWNNHGYPDEDNCRRIECAFEPIPALESNLANAYQSEKCLGILSGKSLSWQIRWLLSKHIV